MNYRSVEDLNKVIVNGLYLVPENIELIVGIPRSGMLAASILALHLNLPMADLKGFLEGRTLGTGKTRAVRGSAGTGGIVQGVNALVIDDSVWTGREMNCAKEAVDKANLPHKVMYATVFAHPDSTDLVDLAFEVVGMPRVFEWNLLHHSILSQSCLDLDGVLCVDPSEQENDDGPRYRDFLLNAPQLLVPSFEIGWIVTSRLEKYRAETETWLSNRKIAYRELRMLDLPSKAERLRQRAHVPFKVSVYRETGAILFVESSLRQAEEILRQTKKPVFCVENRKFYNPATIPYALWNTKDATRRVRAYLSKKANRAIRRVRHYGKRILK